MSNSLGGSGRKLGSRWLIVTERKRSRWWHRFIEPNTCVQRSARDAKEQLTQLDFAAHKQPNAQWLQETAICRDSPALGRGRGVGGFWGAGETLCSCIYEVDGDSTLGWAWLGRWLCPLCFLWLSPAYGDSGVAEATPSQAEARRVSRSISLSFHPIDGGKL